MSSIGPRFLALIIAVLAIALAVVAGRLLQSPWVLSARQRVIRYIAVFVAGVGVWIGIGAFNAPPVELNEAVEELECGGLDETLASAEARGLPAIVDFTADWCQACHELREGTLNHPEVLERDGEFLCAEVDLTGRMDESTEAVREAYGVQGLPHISFIGPSGDLFESHTVRGLVGPAEFLSRLDAVQFGTDVEGSRFERALEENGWFLAFLIVFLGGLATSLTPCVYPLIPVTIALFGAEEAESRREGFLLSLTYVAGIVVTYTVLGVVAALTGSLFGAALQSPWVVGGIAILFVMLALSMLGLFELRLPSGLQNRLSSIGGSGHIKAFLMGLVAGVIAAPCVGPILSGVLLFIAESQDVVLGSALMATFAMGMGVLFVVLGTFSSLISRLPRSGPWMEGVKAAFAIIFIVAALYFVAPHVEIIATLQELPWRVFS